VALIRSSRSEPEPERPRAAPAPSGDTSIIANGMKLDGDCETSGTLRVEGHVTGSVRANRLHIGRTGRVDGDVSGPKGGSPQDAVVIEGQVQGEVRAPRVEIESGGSVGAGLQVTEAVVRGRIAGEVVADKRLLLEETAVVEGDVTAHRLALKEGGQVFGTIRIGERKPAPTERSGGSSSPSRPSTRAAATAGAGAESGGESGSRPDGQGSS
jgi:cytoskeletal protein CcmA (bactofilin family)